MSMGQKDKSERLDQVAEGTSREDDLRGLLRELEDEMREAALKLDYERAALLRDQVREIKTELGMPAPTQLGAEKLKTAKKKSAARGAKRRS
jgi:excinuclease ABC subunit B